MEQVKDPSQDYLQKISQPLDALFFPKTVALIGAKDDPETVANTLWNNLQSLDGKIFPVNPKRETVHGKKVYPFVKDIPDRVDLAVIVTPAKTVPGLVQECAEALVQSVIIISAGFKELGDAGESLEKQIRQVSKPHPMPIIGPNCLGVMNPLFNLNATFAKGEALKGNVAFISQSGALLTAVLDWSFEVNLGFSAFVSVGSMIDVGFADLITYLGNDSNTACILLYMETVGDAAKFLSAAREVALRKPIIVIKPGRTSQAAKAAASHTGSLVGDDAVFDAALERVGVLRVNTISELFDMAEILSKQPLPKGPKLAIITNAGGPAVLATDAAIQQGASVTPLSQQTLEALNAFLPPAWSHHNPIDILGDAKSDTYEKSIKTLIEAKEFDGILAILTPQDMTEPVESAESLLKFHLRKPLLASWMGAKSVEEAKQVLTQGGICTFEFPDEGAKAFAKMWRYHESLLSLHAFSTKQTKIDPQNYSQALKRKGEAEKFFSKEKKILTEEESKALLSLYGIPVVRTLKATDVKMAKECALQLRFPVVLKLLSKTITHKSDVGGVKLNLQTLKDVENAFESIKQNVDKKDFDGVTVQKMITTRGFELIIGSSYDPQFGPVLLFGSGGEMVEVYKDTSLGLPPLNSGDALRLMEKTKIYQAFEGYRDRGAIDKQKLIEILVNFSTMIVENPLIIECDINPLLASSDTVVALDARVVIDGTHLAKTALRPYPLNYVTFENLKDGTSVIMRPIRGDDVPLLKAFHNQLSENTVHLRYLKFLSLSERIADERLMRICINDYTHEFVLVAELKKEEKIIGVIRLSKIPSTNEAQIFSVIADDYQRKGLGTKLMKRMQEIAKEEGIKKIHAKILEENAGMIELCKNFSFEIRKKEAGCVIMERKE